MPAPDGPIVLICGVRADGTLRAIEVTDDDFIKMAFSAAAQGLVGTHGWYDSAWRKAPIPFGASASIATTWSGIDLDAGTNIVNDGAVPAGEAWVITHIRHTNNSASINRVDLGFYNGVTTAWMITDNPTGANQFFDKSIWWILFPGDYLSAKIVNATLNDDWWGNAGGFKIDLDQ